VAKPFNSIMQQRESSRDDSIN